MNIKRDCVAKEEILHMSKEKKMTVDFCRNGEEASTKRKK